MNNCEALFHPAGRSLRKQSLIYFLLTALILAGTGIVGAKGQSVAVQGMITDDASGQPLVGANIVLQQISEQEEQRGSAADRNGFYGMSGLEAGRYIFRVSHVGYVTYTDTLALEAGSRVTVNVAMVQDDELLDEVHVAPTGGVIRRDGGEQRVRAIDIERVPTPAGVGDLASYLQALPGVVSTGDRGGQLFIRGGTPSQNLVLIDGSVIYQPFHIVGFYSVFPEELVSGVDFYAGGFGSRYNSRISSVLDVQMRNGNRNQNRGSASISPFVGELYLEGPIRSGTSSWIASGRRSIIEQTSPWFLEEQQPLRFESQFLKVSHKGRDNSNCSAMVMRTFDRGRLDFESDDVFSWSNFVLGGRCIALPEMSTSFFEMNMGVSNMSNSAGHREDPELTSGITRFNMDINITEYVGKIRLEYGGYTHMKWFNYNMRELFQTPRSDSDVLFGAGLHLEATLPVGERIRIRSGILFSVYLSTYKPSFEPRLRFTWQPFGRDKEELAAAVGLYRQALVGVSDMRDASSVFVAWMPSPIGDSQMEARHALLGWRQTLGAGFQLSVEGYYKRLRNLPVTVWSTLTRFNTNLALADGHVYGSDVRLEYNRGIFYGFTGYGYTWTKYESAQDHFNTWFGEPVQRYHPPHDRRHQINTIFSVAIGQYKANLRWQFGTGLPFTRPMGFDELIRFGDGLPNIRRGYGNPRVILEKPYGGRLPTYHRLDASLERTFHFPVVQLGLQVGAINLYDQTNLFYYDVYTQRRIDQLPIAPYFSLKMETR